MRAVAVIEPGKLELVELDTPTPGPYQALVKTDLAALCNATDGKLVAGHFPGVDKYPLILGHESTGIVGSAGDKVRTFHVGDRVIDGLNFTSLLDRSPGSCALPVAGPNEQTRNGKRRISSQQTVGKVVAKTMHRWANAHRSPGFLQRLG